MSASSPAEDSAEYPRVLAEVPQPRLVDQIRTKLTGFLRRAFGSRSGEQKEATASLGKTYQFDRHPGNPPVSTTRSTVWIGRDPAGRLCTISNDGRPSLTIRPRDGEEATFDELELALDQLQLMPQVHNQVLQALAIRSANEFRYVLSAIRDAVTAGKRFAEGDRERAQAWANRKPQETPKPQEPRPGERYHDLINNRNDFLPAEARRLRILDTKPRASDNAQGNPTRPASGDFQE